MTLEADQARNDTATSARSVEVLLPSSSTRPHHGSGAPDNEELKLTAEQARVYRGALTSRTSTSAPLLTKKHRDQQALEKKLKSKPDKCRVKFKFSDGTQIISVFQPSETVAELYIFVRTVLVDPSAPFELEIPGSRTKLGDGPQELWKDCDFSAGVALQVRGDVVIKSEYKAQGKDVGHVVAQHAAQTAQPEKIAEADKSVQKTISRDAPLKKIPKWLQKGLLKK